MQCAVLYAPWTVRVPYSDSCCDCLQAADAPERDALKRKREADEAAAAALAAPSAAAPSAPDGPEAKRPKEVDASCDPGAGGSGDGTEA